MQHPVVVLLVSLVAIGGGASIVLLRHRLSRFFRWRQRRQGLPPTASLAPVTGLIVGVGWILFGVNGVVQALIRLGAQ